MPQIAQIAEIYASQLFWLVIAFGIIFAMSLTMLPKIQGTVDQRDSQIAGDLAAAEAARKAADAAEEAHRARAEANRAEALKVTQAAKDEAAREAEARLKDADAETNAKVEAAEAQLRAQTDAALADIENVAAEAAQEMVARLSGASVTREQAQAAVKTAMAHG